ncbi:hypothetical protein MMC09_001549 [Bachmanniomyces sp. S44760]|nr:hypothetical protein [Bachmanniomyces sp. S44760]
MPIGIQRLNARHPPPSANIIFIKPLPGPDSKCAEDFLNRIAAICHPIMKANHLSIMSLEEYAPNPEFVGRNFNAGEVIQLVLKRRDGGWLPFRSVQMVMIHELAHCAQMNHGAGFWKVRNAFAGELRELWARGYLGDGLWGRGRSLETAVWMNVSGPVTTGLEPRSLCGGTFRSFRRGRKRKRAGDAGEKPKVSYAERQQRRIAKKFGTNGVALGDDEITRVKLEDGKRPKGKPKVAGSARGRELRAKAALARFEEQKVKGEEDSKVKDEGDLGTDTGDDEDDYEDDLVDQTKEALDFNGRKMLDGQGNGMIKVCEDEDVNDVNVKEEMQELQDINDIEAVPSDTKPDPDRDPDPNPNTQDLHIKQEKDTNINNNNNTINKTQPLKPKTKTTTTTAPRPKPPPSLPREQNHNPSKRTPKSTHSQPSTSRSTTPTPTPKRPLPPQPPSKICPICTSLLPPSTTPTTPHPAICPNCSHVLNPALVPNTWVCANADTNVNGNANGNVIAGGGGNGRESGNGGCNTAYRNAGDCGVCGVCGMKRR